MHDKGWGCLLGVAALASISACGTPRTVWMTEVSRLAMNPLACEQSAIAVSNHVGNTFDSVGCGIAVRYVCRGAACEPSDAPVPDTSSAFAALSRRVAATHAALDAAPLFETCSRGQAFGARLFIRADGTIAEAQPADTVSRCLLRNAPALPGGADTLMVYHVFPPRTR